MLYDFSYPCDHGTVCEALQELSLTSQDVLLIRLGSSLLGRSIPMLRIGRGAKRLLLVGGVHGSEYMTCALLLRFAFDFISRSFVGGTEYGISTRYLLENRTLYVLPMLNPDGVELALHGLDSECPLFDRLMRMCPDGDFTHWQANARGVDLNHNFAAGFEEYKTYELENGISAGATRYSGEYPESEPESAALAGFLRCEDIRMLAAFHTQGEEIYCDSNGYIPKMGRAIGKALARLCSYKLCRPEGAAAYGGLKDAFIREFDLPGYTVECGIGENPLPWGELDRIYASIRPMLFHLPLFM